MPRDKRTPQEVVGLAPPSAKEQIKRELVRNNKSEKVRNPRANKKAKRAQIERNVRRDTGRSKRDLDEQLVAMHDELSSMGVLPRRKKVPLTARILRRLNVRR